jgi:cell pole-organizing protein PopZ
MDVTLPNGTVLRGVPEGTSKEEVKAKAIRAGLATEADFGAPTASDNITIGGGGMAERIPGQTQQAPQVAPEQQVQNPSMLDYAIQGAAAVPILGAGTRLLQGLAKGGKAAPYFDDLARAVMPQSGKRLAYEGALGAAIGVGAGKAAEQAPEEYQDLVGTLSGVVLGGAAGMGKNAFDTWASRGMGGDMTRAGLKAADAMGGAQASSQAQTALRANPELGPAVARATEIEQNTGISLPMLAASNGDTTISSFLASQTSRGNNAEFTAALKQQYLAAEKALTAAQRGKAPTMQAVDAYVKRKAAEAQVKNEQIVAQAAQRAARREQGLENINNRLADLTAEVNNAPTNLQTGQKLVGLLNAKEAAIRSELSPQYSELLENATKQGIKLSGEAARDLRNFTSDQLNRDVFQKFPSLYNMIQKEFASPNLASPRIADKYRIAAQAQQPKDVPLSTLDSLKREVNRAIRDTDNRDDLRRLSLLKEQVDNAIDTVDPSFVQPYRALDREYATRLGVPFKERGVVNIDRSRFVEDTVPNMTKNASSLKQVMSIIGDDPQGVQLAKDAFMFDISQNRGIISTTTGEINPAQLRRYMAQNKDKIDQVPGLRQDLDGLMGRVGSLVDNRSRILTAQRGGEILRENRTRILNAQNQAQAEKVENLWTQAFGTDEGLRGIVRSSVNNPAKLDGLLKLTETDPMARVAIKSAMLDDVLSAPGNRIELFQKNRGAFEKVYGAKDTDNLGFVIEASQRLKDNPFKMSINPSTINKTKFEEVVGTKPANTAALLRNQVQGAFYKFSTLMSRFVEKRASAAETAEMQRFLLNPKALEDTASMMRELELNGINEKSVNLLSKIVKNSGFHWLAGGTTGAIVSQSAPPAEPYMPTDPGLLEGFGVPNR